MTPDQPDPSGEPGRGREEFEQRRIPRSAVVLGVAVVLAAAIGALAGFVALLRRPSPGPVVAVARARPAASPRRAPAPRALLRPSTAPSPTAEPLAADDSDGSTAPAVPSPGAGSACGTPEQRGAAALALLRHPEELRATAYAFRAARAGVLADQSADGRTTLVFVRSCRAEPLAEVAASLVFEVAQARERRGWTAAQRAAWLRLRGIPGQWSLQARQDVGATAVLWELGPRRRWRGSFAPPTRVTPALVRLLLAG